MLTILGITFPIFAMVVLGYVLVWRGMFKPADMKTFGTWALNIALPALIFHAVASRPVAEVFNLAYMGVYLAGALITIALGFLWFSATQDPSRRGVAIMGTTCPNSGFIGYPLMLVLLPDQAGLILAFNMLVENIVIIPLVLFIMELGKPKGHGHPARQLARVFAGLARRPLVSVSPSASSSRSPASRSPRPSSGWSPWCPPPPPPWRSSSSAARWWACRSRATVRSQARSSSASSS